MNPLKTLTGTVITGFVVALIIAALLSSGHGAPLEWAVWLHVIVGILWVGLLYYFNFVQVPAVGAALADGDPGPAAINKYVAPRALFYFRWASVLTWLTGAGALGHMGIFADAFLMKEGAQVIGMGAWLGTIMLFNVWVLIWPNQKKLLGMVPASDAEKAKAKNIAFIASRTNVVLSIPMLLGMTAYQHGLPF